MAPGFLRLSCEREVTGVRIFKQVELEHHPDSPFDLQFSVDSFTLGLHFTYDGRENPVIKDADKASTGVLGLSLEWVRMQYLERRWGESGMMAKHLSELFESTSGKCWLYHPREARIRKGMREELKSERKQLSGEAEFAQQRRPVSDSKKRPAATHGQGSAVKPWHKSPTLLGRVMGTHRCTQCNDEWCGDKILHCKCDRCETYMHSTFTPFE